MSNIDTAQEGLPRDPIADGSGQITRGWRNYLESRGRRLGEIISGVNLNRQSIVDLSTSVTTNLGIETAARIAADAVVSADATSANATLSTTLTTAFQAADTALQTDINTRATNTRVDTVESNAASALSSSVSSLTAAYTAADAVLQTDINTRATVTQLATAESNATSANATLSSTLTAAYQAADTTLQANITSEASTRATADTALSTSITSLTATVGTNTASITTNSSAIATLNSSSAVYEVLVAASGGQPARIRLKAGIGGSTVEIDGNEVFFGAQTRFDTSTETFITEVGSVRSRYGTAFGAGGSQVVMWHGPTSVALGSEARNNGYFAIGTDGSTWRNTAALDWGATAAEAAASNALVPMGANACVDSEFQRDLYAWQVGWAGNQGQPHSVTKNTYGAAARHYYVANVTGTPSAGTVFDVLATKGTYISTDLANTKLFGMPVAPGDRVYAGAQFSAVPTWVSAVGVRVNWLDKDGAALTDTEAASSAPVDNGLTTIASWPRIGGFVTAPANAAFAIVFFRATCSGVANPYCAITSPILARVPSNQTAAIPYTPGRPDPIGDQTGANTAASITGQGVFATGNYYEQSTDPGSVANGSFWFKTTTNELFVRRSAAWGKVATIANQNLTITRTNGFVKTRIGSGTITSDSVSFSSSGGSGTGYTYAHELFATYTTGPSPTISSASGSPITASASGAVPGDEVRGFIQTTATDSEGNRSTLTSPLALFCES
jgi:hypothetical protein